jgi:hypothetical protein
VDPQSVAAADLDGDGRLDLVVANRVSNTVSVLVNQGEGTFAAKVDYPTGDAPNSVVVVDLNGDGKPDLAVANIFAGSVSVLLNQGDGTFAAKIDYLAGPAPSSVAAADLNGDGKPDLAVGNNDSTVNTVTVLLNRGDGAFARFDYAVASAPFAVATVDLNGDGRPDLAVASGSRSPFPAGGSVVGVLLNHGDGTFAARVDYPMVSALIYNAPAGVATADLNGDGAVDLAIACKAGACVFLNRGDGTFGAEVDYPTQYASSAAAADLNGDGKPDLAVTNGEHAVSVLLNHGEGAFAPKRDYWVGLRPSSVAVADLNGDGLPDLAVADSEQTSVNVLLACQQ